MFFYVENSIFLVPESLSRIVPAEPLDEGDGSLGHVPRELDVVDAPQDDVVDLHWVTGSERGTIKTKQNTLTKKLYLLAPNGGHLFDHYLWFIFQSVLL